MQTQTSRQEVRKRARPVAAALVLMLGLASVALTDSPRAEELPRVTVKYGDLDLSTAEGTERLLRRIKGGARQVCGDPDGTRDLARWLSVRRCYSQAVARAVEDVQAARLTEAYRASHSIGRTN